MIRQLAAQDAIVALGSNLDQPCAQIQRAFDELAGLPQCRLIARSSLYGSTPVGPQQPDYVNAVAHLQTGLEPHALLDQLQALERLHQRVREQRWGARTLDLDIALFGRREVQSERLTVPHMCLAERSFVLLPLAELYPNLQINSQGVSVLEQLELLPKGGIWRLADTHE